MDMIYQKEDFRKLFDISSDVFSKLEIYHALLLKWQKAINLVSPNSIPQAWHRHFIDSSQLVELIPETAKIYADLGCGAGFPGLVLAIMRPELEVHLVESDERKCQFMRTVARETGANVQIHTKRIENVSDDFCPDFVTARALSSLENLFEYCLPWAQKNKNLELCFLKGARAEEELEIAKKKYSFDYTSTQSITDSGAQILSIQNLTSM